MPHCHKTMEQLDASTLARWAAEPALYETPGKLETANDDWQRGVLRLSASGVVFCDDGRAARGMALDSVVRVTVGERKRFLKKARLTVELQGAAGTCAFDARDAFRRDAFAKACERALVAARRRTASGFTTQTAGIAGLARKRRAKRDEAGALAAETRDDVRALMAEASAVVSMLQKYQARADRASGDDAALGAARQLGAMRVADDDAAAVDAGDGKLLADAAAAFASKLLGAGAAKSVTLTDLWCRFNRARGASGLVSPEDFADACGRYLDRRSPDFSRGAPATLRVFRSGVKVVALADDDTRARVVAHAAGGATAMGLAVALAVPPALAAELLADAEHDGALCRDKSSAGLAFYPNAFATRGVLAYA